MAEGIFEYLRKKKVSTLLGAREKGTLKLVSFSVFFHHSLVLLLE